MATRTTPEPNLGVLQVAAPDLAVDAEADLRIPGRPGRLARYEGAIIGTMAVVVFLGVWQAVATARLVPELFLPGPTDIFKAFVILFSDINFIRRDLWVSGQEVVYGYGLAVILALPLGMLMGWYRRLSYGLDPFISFLYSSPRVALLPLMIIWLGIGMASKIAIIFLGAFFPIVINTAVGVRNLDPSLLKAARSFGASDAQIFRTIALPGSVILAGLRLGVGHAMVGVFVGELVAAQAGVGLMMATAGATFQTSKVFAGLIIIAGTGILLTHLIQRLERRFQAWMPSR